MLVLRRSWRRLEDFFSVKSFCLPRRFSSRHLEDVLEDKKLLRWRRIQDVLMLWKRLENQQNIDLKGISNKSWSASEKSIPSKSVANKSIANSRQNQDALISTQWFLYTLQFQSPVVFIFEDLKSLATFRCLTGIVAYIYIYIYIPKIIHTW